MVTVTIDNIRIEKAIDFAVLAGAQVLEAKIVEITPRDLARPPKDPSRKVTGNLKRSIWTQRIDSGKYLVGVRQWYLNAAKYGAYLEFWTVRMAPRSFLRKWIEDNINLIQNVIKQAFSQYLK